jgi:hypothetical protein
MATKPADVPWAYRSELKACFEANPHGAGFAYERGGKVHVSKGYFSFKPLWRALRKVEDRPVLLHFRYATHGSKSAANCHPFLLANGCAAAHNGVLDIDVEGDMTDSETFFRAALERFKPATLGAEPFVLLAEMAIGGGNKVAVLRPDGTFVHYNRHLGVEHRGMWFSNRSFERPKKIESRFSVYGGYDYSGLGRGWRGACASSDASAGDALFAEKRKACDGDCFNCGRWLDMYGRSFCSPYDGWRDGLCMEDEGRDNSGALFGDCAGCRWMGVCGGEDPCPLGGNPSAEKELGYLKEA